jgi:hypothetical protein
LQKEEGSEGSGLAEKMEPGREKSARGRRWPLNKGSRENKGARGPVGAQPHGGVGGLAMARARAGGGGPGTSGLDRAAATRGRWRRVVHGGGRGRERRREQGGRLASGAPHRVGPSCKREGIKRQVGPATIQIKFKIIQIYSNLV